MSTEKWYTILGPNDWNGLKLETGNRSIDTTYKNIISSHYACLVAPTTMYIVGGSGIELITPGFVDASGIRAIEVRAQNIRSVDASGNVQPRYVGASGGLIYKETDDTHGVDGNIVVASGELTMPLMGGSNVLWINPSGNKLESFPQLYLEAEKIIPPEEPGQDPIVIPAKIYASGGNADFICENIQIGQAFPAYRGSVLTHSGEEGSAVWTPASYLDAEGAIFSRYPKRPCYIFGRRPASTANSTVLIATSNPSWAGLGLKATGTPDPLDADQVESLNFEKEFGIADTLAIVKATTREKTYVKFASSVSYLSTDSEDVDTEVTGLAPTTDGITDSLGNEVSVLSIDICGSASGEGQGNTGLNKPGYDSSSNEGMDGFYTSDVSGIPDGAYYIYSVTRGAYFSMGLDADATDELVCGTNDVSTSPDQGPLFTFKPSTQNHISIRPNISTSFNSLAEDIDFAIYGKMNIEHNNYSKDAFDKDESLLPTGMAPAFFVDAYQPDSAYGTARSGVAYSQWLDRDKTIPSGYQLDHRAKICINTYDPYVVDSITNSGNLDIASYLLPPGKSSADYNSLNLYAQLTVKGITYSDEIITNGLYFMPKPQADNAGEYISNALLTIDRTGKVVPRVPQASPKAPGQAQDVLVYRNGNGDASITWTAAPSNGKDVLYYYIEFSLNDGETWTELPESDIYRPVDNVNFATISNLIPNVEYIFAVTAQNSIGIGDRSVIDTGNMDSYYESNLNVPSMPYNISGIRFFPDYSTASTTSYVTLSWKSPMSNGSSSLQGFLIEESDNKGATWTYYNTTDNLIDNNYIVDINGSEWYQESIYGLTNGTNYTYRISAINASGQSSFGYVYMSGNVPPELEQEAIEKRQAEEEEVLSNWDFGDILFTGVCQV